MKTTHPTKEQVRAYLLQRQSERTPPPAPEQIKDALDWHCEKDIAVPAECANM